MNISLTPVTVPRVFLPTRPVAGAGHARLERPAPSVFNALLDPLGQRTAQRRTRRHEDPQAVAQDYLQYMLSDYEERRGQGHRNWRDLCPVYAFALTTHAADWPRGMPPIPARNWPSTGNRCAASRGWAGRRRVRWWRMPGARSTTSPLRR